jgi:hypothetical protein
MKIVSANFAKAPVGARYIVPVFGKSLARTAIDVAHLALSCDQITKTCHFDRSEPTLLPFRFLLRNRSVHAVEKPLFDFSATWIDPVK